MTFLMHSGALIIGLATLSIGILAVFKPKAMSKNFGIQATPPAFPFVVSMGIRDVFIGLVFLVLYFSEDWNALAYLSSAVGIVAMSDFFVVQKYGNKKVSRIHLFGAIAVFSYSAWLVSQV